MATLRDDILNAHRISVQRQVFFGPDRTPLKPEPVYHFEPCPLCKSNHVGKISRSVHEQGGGSEDGVGCHDCKLELFYYYDFPKSLKVWNTRT